jgi:hypothetical protein
MTKNYKQISLILVLTIFRQRTEKYGPHQASLYQSLPIGFGGPLAMGMVSAARSCLAFAMSTYITRPFSTCHNLAFVSSSPRHIRKQIPLCSTSTLQKESLALPFISSLALLASSSEANFTKPNPFGLLVTLSVMTVAAIKHDAPSLGNNIRKNND